ncbi:molecular chaperone Hsp33 [Clostridium collagenovorans DSM 3089]|uniref:33 kDa chaperonin n=1 Tax=Clostridium collagenovorans DSM 3089 TaxID=1121306 RepID=A0A1M5VSW6_9CLOT|nr:Hsp33 family molecular chaperone HslO [Clostridium collagenovorans]SHH78084.1 molecular chaperone Hsp33 [Clostridium collagenovorans DSM 3089]
MSDKLIRATAHSGDVRITVAITTEMVNEATKIHGCTPTAAAALGRMLTAGSIMGSMMKSEKDKLTLKIDGGGEAKGVVVTASSDASVKGFIGNPRVELPTNEKGKLDVGGAIGKDGSLIVIRDMGLKEPYVGHSPIYTGEIGDDLAYYYTVSEQIPTAVGVGVLVDVDHSIKASGGLIIQMMPGAPEGLADIITFRLEENPPITKLISEGKTVEDILNLYFDDMDLKLYDTVVPQYLCDCKREKVEKALISLGKQELESIHKDGKTESIQCQFCGRKYDFTPEDLLEIINNL